MPSAAVHRLQVRARLDLGQLELENQLVGSERRRRAIVLGGQAVQLGELELAPVGRMRAPIASSAAAGSEGCAEAQKSFPKKACSRCWPSRAWQVSPPWSRHGNCRRQYQQRVAWSRLPPIVPMFRSCGDAASRHASRSAPGSRPTLPAPPASCRRRSCGRRSRAAAPRARRRASRPQDPVAEQRHELRAARERAAARERGDRLRRRARPLQLQRAPSPSSPRPRGARAGSPRA